MNEHAKSAIYSPNSKVFGLPYTEWTIRWWKWLLSIPRERNPANDRSGVNASENQNDPHVWFLAGTFGGYAERNCIIPRGKAIFMPIINYECSFAATPRIRKEDELYPICKSEIDDITDIKLAIDGFLISDLSQYRTCSGLFSIDLIESNILNIVPCNTKMITDGYWIFLKPPTVGKHTISTSASCQSGKTLIKTSYDLIVK